MPFASAFGSRLRWSRMPVWLGLVGVLATGFIVLGPSPRTSGHGGHGVQMDLRSAPPEHQVRSIVYCKGIYTVSFADGSTQTLKEFDVRFQTESGPNGPPKGSPVHLTVGARGGAGFIIFSEPGEFAALIRSSCK